MRTGTGANKTTSEDILSAEVKAAGGVNLILLQGAAETRTYHLATNGVAVPCSVHLMDFLVPETASSPS